MTPVFGHGHLRLYLLKLLDESPKHGYELIQALSGRFGGTYAPSAGTIYPRLSKLEEEGLVTKASDGRKTVYQITEAGRVELAARDGELDSIEEELTDSVRRLADEVRAGVGVAMKSLRADLASAARQAREAPRSSGSRASGSSSTGSGAGDEDWGPASGSADARGGNTDPRLSTRFEIRDVDIALAEFRQSVRTELRSRGVRGVVPEGTAARLKAGLDAVKAALLDDLGS